MALSMQSLDVSFLETTYHATYLLGTEAPDNPEHIGDSYEHHVYYYSSGSLQDDASAERASDMYASALDRLEAGDFSVAAYYIGAMTHYIADMGVFGHTMGAYTDWGAEEHHADYEEEFESMLGSLDLPSGLELGNMTAYDAALDLARDVTFGSGDIMPNIWMDDNYDWSDGAFVDSAMTSLYASVSAVAAAVNHLMFEAGYEAPPEPDPTTPEEPEPEPEPDPVAPSEPMGLEGYAEDGEVVLMWSPPLEDGGASVIEYIVYRGEGTAAMVEVARVPSGALVWRDTSVEAGETYRYCVAARNSVGTGEDSDVVSVTLPSDGERLLLPAVAAAVLAFLLSVAALVFRGRRR